MIKIEIPVQHEDKFGILLQLLNQSFHKNKYSIENIEIADEANKMFWIIDYHHPKLINSLLIKIKDLGEIIGIEIHYCFVYTKEEAYTGNDTISRRGLVINKLC